MKLTFPLFVFIFSIVSGFSFSQDSTSQIVSDSSENLLVGEVDRYQLQQDEFGQHFKEEYALYNPCTETLQQLKKEIYNKSIVIVLATWCHDSQIQVGRFYKILDLLDYNTNRVTTICLDRDKLAGELDINKFDIKLVPTFIFLNDSKALGRIIESPKTSLEKDIVQILNQ